MRLRTLLETGSLGLRLLGGEDELDRTVRGVMTTDLRDPSRYLSGGELVLTGLAWQPTAADAEPFVRILAGSQVAALATGEAELGTVPNELVTACRQHRLPLFAVAEDVAFATITEHVLRQVSTERAGDLAAVVNRHRRLVSTSPDGGGPEALLDLLLSDLDLRAWVLSATGRQVATAGSVGAGAGAGESERRIAGGGNPACGEPTRSETPVSAPGTRTLPAPVRAQLSGAHLAAVRGGRPSPYRTVVDNAAYALLPVRSDEERQQETMLSDWLLAVRADPRDWPAERLELLRGVTQLIAAERDRRDASRTVRRRLAQEVLELVQNGAPSGDVAARLRVAAPVLLPELGNTPHWQVLVARVEWEPGGTGSGEAAQFLLEEMLSGPWTAAEPEGGDRAAVAHTAQEAVALVPLPSAPDDRVADSDDADSAEEVTPSQSTPTVPGGQSAGTATRGAEHDTSCTTGVELRAERLLEAVRVPLERGLADAGRLTLGVSATVHSADGLRGALEEARHARRVAAARTGTVCAAGHEELASHVLLLPFVPDDVRRAFTARLLDPVRAYDQRHGAELVPTLETFLAANGSWTRCASRMHLHVNTLRYRVGRIEQLTGRDLSRLEDKLDFFLALRMS